MLLFFKGGAIFSKTLDKRTRSKIVEWTQSRLK